MTSAAAIKERYNKEVFDAEQYHIRVRQRIEMDYKRRMSQFLRGVDWRAAALLDAIDRGVTIKKEWEESVGFEMTLKERSIFDNRRGFRGLSALLDRLENDELIEKQILDDVGYRESWRYKLTNYGHKMLARIRGADRR